MERKQPSYWTSLVTALLVMAIAALAAAGLWVIRNMYRQSSRAVAARSVIDSGRMIAAQLADQPVIRVPETGNVEWAGFSRLVRSLRKLEKNLQYVSVSRKGVTVFHEQLSGIDGGELPPERVIATIDPREVLLGKEILIVGTNTLPVVVFTANAVDSKGQPVSVQVAVRREAIESEHKKPSDAIATMFRVSLVTITMGFCICAALVLLMMRRDARREEHRRAGEHLAFAGAMANGIAHDFRNPMSSLKLDVQMLQKEAAKQAECRPGRIIELASRAGNTIDRMDKIFQEFLFLSRPASDTRETVRLNACIRDCLDLLTSRFEQAGVAIRTQFQESDPEVVGQPTSLKRAIINLLANAEHFSPRGGSVTIRCASEKDSAIVEIIDEGPGVPDGEKERIFEMFVTNREGGTGLGLALAKTAIENCGGKIGVENRTEGGACFRMVLPLAVKQEASLSV